MTGKLSTKEVAEGVGRVRHENVPEAAQHLHSVTLQSHVPAAAVLKTCPRIQSKNTTTTVIT